MYIDFSAIDAVSRGSTKEAPPENPRHQTDNGIAVLQRAADQARVDRERAIAVYQEYQRAIIASEEGMREILLGLQRGVPTDLLFLQAVEALAAATSNRVFLQQVQTAMTQPRHKVM